GDPRDRVAGDRQLLHVVSAETLWGTQTLARFVALRLEAFQTRTRSPKEHEPPPFPVASTAARSPSAASFVMAPRTDNWVSAECGRARPRDTAGVGAGRARDRTTTRRS